MLFNKSMKLFFKCLQVLGVSLFSKSNYKFSIINGSSLLLTPPKKAVLKYCVSIYLNLYFLPLIFNMLFIFLIASNKGYQLPVKSSYISEGVLRDYLSSYNYNKYEYSLEFFHLLNNNTFLSCVNFRFFPIYNINKKIKKILKY